MEGNIYENDIKEYNIYCSYILQYEYYLKDIYKNLNNIAHRGYLIDLKEFEKLKEELSFQIFKRNRNEYNDNILFNIVSLDSENKPYKLKKLEAMNIVSHTQLLDMLKNKKEYIFINTDLWKTICKEGQEEIYRINYFINNSELFFYLKDNNCIHFHNNKNNIINQ